MKPIVTCVTCLATALALVSCSPEDEAAPTASTTTVTSPAETVKSAVEAPATADTATDNTSPIGEASLDNKTGYPKGGAQLLATNIRVGHHQGFDRIVFDLEGTGTPGYFVSYTDEPAQQASGFPLVPAGDSYLQVMIDGTAYPFEVGQEARTLSTTPNEQVVKDILDGGMFEAQSQYIVGINGPKKPFAVAVLTNPTRLVVDVITD